MDRTGLALSPGLMSCATGAGGRACRSPEKVLEAARQFEALLIGQMLRSAREAGGEEGWMGAEGANSGPVMEYAETHLANLLSERGGFGLAKLIAQGLADPAASSGAPERGGSGQSASTPPGQAAES